MTDDGSVDRPVRPMVDAYEDFCGVERGRFDGCTYEEMESGTAWPGFREFRVAWHARLQVTPERRAWSPRQERGCAVDLIEDLRAVLRWEEKRMDAVSAGVLREVIVRLELGEE